LNCIFAAVDGWTARQFNQESKFGAWFDVVIDNIGRGILWTRISSVKRNILLFIKINLFMIRSEF